MEAYFKDAEFVVCLIALVTNSRESREVENIVDIGGRYSGLIATTTRFSRDT